MGANSRTGYKRWRKEMQSYQKAYEKEHGCSVEWRMPGKDGLTRDQMQSYYRTQESGKGKGLSSGQLQSATMALNPTDSERAQGTKFIMLSNDTRTHSLMRDQGIQTMDSRALLKDMTRARVRSVDQANERLEKVARRRIGRGEKMVPLALSEVSSRPRDKARPSATIPKNSNERSQGEGRRYFPAGYIPHTRDSKIRNMLRKARNLPEE